MNFIEEQQAKQIDKYNLREYDNTAYTMMKRSCDKEKSRVSCIVKDTIIATCERIQITLNPRGSFNTPVNTINVTNMMIDTLISQAKDEQILTKPVHNNENEQTNKLCVTCIKDCGLLPTTKAIMYNCEYYLGENLGNAESAR